MSTTPEPILPTYVDSTMISAFRSCPHKFYEEFVYGLRPSARSVDLHAGAAMSSALEAFYTSVYSKGVTIEEATRTAFRTMTVEYGDFVPDSDSPKTLDNMMVALDSYLKTYAPFTDHVQPLFPEAAEFSFAIPLDDPAFPLHPSTGDPYVYAGRLDMLGQYQGRPCVKDDKTTKAAGAKWADQWDLRSQFMGYIWACQRSGIDVNTAVIRGIVIQKTSIRQLEAIKVYPQHLIDRWYAQLVRDITNITHCYEDGYWDYNLAETCSSYGGCVFKPICQAKEANQDNWRTSYVTKRWNPLAKNQLEMIDPLPGLVT